MSVKSSFYVIKKLLSGFAPPMQKKLLHHLIESKREIIDTLPEEEKEILLIDETYDTLVDSVHYSWYIPILKTLNTQEAKSFLLALSSSNRKKLQSQLKLELPKEKLKPSLKKYFRTYLLSSLIGEERDLLPKSFLPNSPLNVLLNFKKEELIELIDLLSMYELKYEMLKIVDPHKIKSIENVLSKKQLTFLKKLQNVQDPYLIKNLSFKSEETIRYSLHENGLFRLGKALYKEHAHFNWYIIHLLDIGRGLRLEKIIKTPVREEASLFILKQILFVIQTLK